MRRCQQQQVVLFLCYIFYYFIRRRQRRRQLVHRSIGLSYEERQKIRDQIIYKLDDGVQCRDITRMGTSTFKESCDILRHEGGLCSIDSRTNMWTAEHEVWKPLIEANPMAKKWMMAPVPNYEKLVNLFGNDRATGERSMTAKEKRNRMTSACESAGETIQFIDEVSQNQVVLEPFIKLGDKCEVQVEPNTGSLLKRKRRRSANEDDLKEIEIMKDAFEKVANAIEKSNVVPEPRQSNKYSKEDVFPTFEVIGLEEELQTEAYLHLADDKDRMKTFFACPSSKRKNVLLRMLSRSGIM
ncbi:hypothetical protein EJ110_NYTH23585 [Nymphaea thermarum]|nr:hypothetical protein EJ110_NYTH23585 [Nymphaea thermarum]